jgi:hypothetical protein
LFELLENSYIAKMDEAGNIKVYDVNGNEVVGGYTGFTMSIHLSVRPSIRL